MELLVMIVCDSREIRKKSPAETVRLEFDYSERFEYLVSLFLLGNQADAVIRWNFLECFLVYKICN